MWFEGKEAAYYETLLFKKDIGPNLTSRVKHRPIYGVF